MSSHCCIKHDDAGGTLLGKKFFVPNFDSLSFNTILQDNWTKYNERLQKRYPDQSSSFNMGYGCMANDIVKATDLLFQREYPSIYYGEQDNGIFIPENFLSKSVAFIGGELTEEQEEERSIISSKEKGQSSAYIPMPTIEGDKAERHVYENLIRLFRDGNSDADSSDVVVLHGHDIEIFNQKRWKQQETDFIIISPKRKLFSIIEIKHRYDFTNKNRKDRLRKVIKQLRSCRDIIQNYFSDIFDSSWNFIETIYFHEFSRGDDVMCAECLSWILTKDSSFENWWNSIQLLCPIVPLANQQLATTQFREWFRLFVFLVHKNPGAVTTSLISEYLFEDVTKKVGSPENILFWTSQQRDLLNNPEYTRVMFMSSFGTGKTLMLCEKAKQLALLNQESTFILWTSGSAVQTLLNIDLNNRFSNPLYQDRIKFVTSRELMKELGSRDVNFLSSHLLEYLKTNSPRHVFIDEWYWAERNDVIHDFEACLSSASDRCLWITWHRDTISSWDNQEHDALKKICADHNFVVPSLNHSMRNTKTIIEAAKQHGGEEAKDIAMPSHNFPVGIEKRNIMLEDGRNKENVLVAFNEAIGAARLRSKKGILIVTNTEPIGGLTEKEFDLVVDSLKEICVDRGEPLTVYCLHDRYQERNFGEVKDFIVHNKGVLFTDHRAIEGYECETVICYAGREQQTGHMSTSNFVMRCVVNCYVIQQPTSVTEKRDFTWDDYIVRFKRDNTDVRNRELSFETWPSDCVQVQTGLIRAGFYYMGVDDLVKCCSCGGKRSANKDFAEGDPVSLHLQYYPNCKFAQSLIK